MRPAPGDRNDRAAALLYSAAEIELLLDQGFLAGVGNYLRSGILCVARWHPDARPGALDRAQQRQRYSCGVCQRAPG